MSPVVFVIVGSLVLWAAVTGRIDSIINALKGPGKK